MFVFLNMCKYTILVSVEAMTGVTIRSHYMCGKPDPGPPQEWQALLTPESSARCYAHSYTRKVLVHLVLNSALSLSHGLKGGNTKEDTFILAHGFRALVHG